MGTQPRRTAFVVINDDWLRPRGGGEVKRAQIAQALTLLGEVIVVVMGLGPDAPTAGPDPVLLPSGEQVELYRVPGPERDPRHGAIGHLKAALRPAVATDLVALLERLQPDAVVVDSIYLFGQVPHLPGPTVAVTQNCDSALRMDHARHAERWQDRYGGRVEGMLLARDERKAFAAAAQVWCVSRSDIEQYRTMHPRVAADYRLVRNAIERTPDDDGRPKLPQIGYFGSLGWQPNQMALQELVAVSDRLLAAGLQHQVLVSGANLPAALEATLSAKPQVKVLGFVPDLDEALGSVSCFAFPLIYGGGTKYKVLEALARGWPVVTTGEGIHGVDGLEDGVHLLVREAGPGFDEAVASLLRDPASGRRLGAAARTFVLEHFGPDSLRRDVADAMADLPSPRHR